MGINIFISITIAMVVGFITSVISTLVIKMIKKKEQVFILTSKNSEIKFNISNKEEVIKFVNEYMNTPQVFISYSIQDIDLARNISDYLIKNGLRVWFDQNNISIGNHIGNKIKKAINESSYYLILISKNTTKSDWIRFELNEMIKNEKEDGIDRIIPILVDDVSMPDVLMNRKYIDISNGNLDNLKELVKRLKI